MHLIFVAGLQVSNVNYYLLSCILHHHCPPNGTHIPISSALSYYNRKFIILRLLGFRGRKSFSVALLGE